MYFLTYEWNEEQAIGVLTRDRTHVIPLHKAEKAYFGTTELPKILIELVQQSEVLEKVRSLVNKVEDDGDFNELLAVDEIVIKAPIPRPSKNIFCIGKNYKAHAFEFEKTSDENVAIPKHPVIFSKVPTAVIGPNEQIDPHPTVTKEVDYEAELAIVIGKTGKNIAKKEAMDYVFGYTIINDVTARDLQRDHAQWLKGKGLDTFAPMGPYLVHKSSIPDHENLDVVCRVNGEIRQQANTKDLLFDIPTIISSISKGLTLEPGDMIATGTPAGVGIGFDPPKYLKSGDVVEIEITHLGVLTNEVK